MIASDSGDDKRRETIVTTLMGLGNYVPFSVFLFDLDCMRMASLRGRLSESVHARDD